jgi:hypothetical protein
MDATVSIRSETLERVTGLPPIPWSAGFLHRYPAADARALLARIATS